MASMSQEKKAEIAGNLKRALHGSGVSYSLSVRHHSTLVMTIRQSSIDFIGNYNETVAKRPRPEHLPLKPAEKSLDINPYWYKEHFTGKALAVLSLIMPILNNGNHDRSDLMNDYFDVGWYVDVKIGKWDQPYVLTTSHGIKQAV